MTIHTTTQTRWAACPIRGLRIHVWVVIGMIADGMTVEETLTAFPDLEGKDIREALRYAAEAVRERELLLASAV